MAVTEMNAVCNALSTICQRFCDDLPFVNGFATEMNAVCNALSTICQRFCDDLPFVNGFATVCHY